MSKMSAAVDRLKQLEALSPAKRAAFMRMLQKKSVLSANAQLIPRRPQHDSAPLSFAQQRLWFIDQLVTGRSLYHLSAAVRLSGQLDVRALEQSLTEVIRRHESLRTSFRLVNNEPMQIIAPAYPCSLPVLDLSEVPQPEQVEKIKQVTVEEAQEPFDLSVGPVIRILLLKLSPKNHVFLFTIHHIAGDGWSMGIFFGEVAALYEAFASGRKSPLPELPIQYADFAVWQRESLQGEELESQLDYWRRQLGNNPEPLELPLDHPRPPVQTHRGATMKLALSVPLSNSLKELSLREGVTLFMTLLAAFKTLLYRYSNQQEIVVGTDIANRRRKEVEGLIGFFVNQLVLRTSLAGDPTFRELLTRVREVTLGAYAHQDLPFDRLVQELVLERELNRSPLFQAKFVLQNAPRKSIDLPSLKLSFIEVEHGTTPFDLLLEMSDGVEGLTGLLSYSTDLFEETTIERLIEHFKRLLEQVIADPDQRLSSYRLMSDEETHGLAPADFADADLSQKDFEFLLALKDL